MANRVFIVRREMLKLIEDLDAPGMSRDETIQWEKIHMISSACIGYELAVRRGVDPEIASTACTLHDIGRVYTGKQQDHARAGYKHALDFLTELNRKYTGLFTSGEIAEIAEAVSEHSNKDVTGTPLCEIVKDADVLDLHYYGIELPRPEQKKRLENLLSTRSSS